MRCRRASQKARVGSKRRTHPTAGSCQGDRHRRCAATGQALAQYRNVRVGLQSLSRRHTPSCLPPDTGPTRRWYEPDKSRLCRGPGVPRHTFSAMFGAIITRGDDYRQTFQHFRPGFDLAVERLRREQADFPERFDEHDLYPDARPCLEKLRQLGFLVGITGNQTAQAERLLRALSLPADFISTSDGWGSKSRPQSSCSASSPSAGAREARSPTWAIGWTTTSARRLPPGWSRCSCGAARGVHPRRTSRRRPGAPRHRVTRRAARMLGTESISRRQSCR
jgi:hypothetical protein